MSGRPLRVVLVDDHEMVRHGLKAMLARHQGEVRIVGEAASSDEAARVVRTLEPDVILCDIRIGTASGLDLAATLLAERSERRLVFLTVYDDEQYLFQALRAGAAGYLLKQIDAPELVRQLQRVADGDVVVDPVLAGRVASAAARMNAGEFWPGARLGLTQRESEVLSLMVAGLSNKAIAAKLVVSEETVKTHTRGIYRKLEVSDRSGAVAAAIREGLFK